MVVEMAKKVITISISEEAYRILERIVELEKEVHGREVSMSSVIEGLINKYGSIEVSKLSELKKDIERLRSFTSRAQEKLRRIILDFENDEGWEPIEM